MQPTAFIFYEVGLDGVTSPYELLVGGHHVLFLYSRGLAHLQGACLAGLAPQFQAWRNIGEGNLFLPAPGVLVSEGW
jgi:hypothetical protein